MSTKDKKEDEFDNKTIMTPEEIAELWKCPKCGETEFIVYTYSIFVRTGEEDFEDYYTSVPKKIWCMKCQQELPVSDKQKVQFN